MYSKRIRSPLSVTRSISGGSINQCFRLGSGPDSFFLKVNNEKRYPEMFLKEAMGLKLLADTRAVAVPAVIGVGASGGEQFLLLEWINRGAASAAAHEQLGRCLASLHRHTNPSFGLQYSNYIGALEQSNKSHASWPEFFIAERLEPQVKLAYDRRLINRDTKEIFYDLYKNMETLLPEEPPALVHGDLWSGNWMTDEGSAPFLIDPAVAFSNRECDIAMTRLFGGFSRAFYGSYNENYPLQKGWEKRVDLLNLYPLLVHVNLFGTSYLQAVLTAVRQYT